MRVTQKQVVRKYNEQGAPLCAAALYISDHQPLLLRRIGWEIADDIHDDYSDEISYDNGHTWSTPIPRPQWSKTDTDTGYIMHAENAMFYVPENDILWHFTNRRFHTHLDFHVSASSSQLCITNGNPIEVYRNGGTLQLCSDFEHPQGVALSFCVPIQDKKGRLLLPVYWRAKDDVISPSPFLHYDSGVLIGEKNDTGDTVWVKSEAIPFDSRLSTRGLCEGTIAELSDGRFAMVLRGSNAGRPDLPGYKWVSFSDGCNHSWSPAVPLSCDDGILIESSATGSKLFRSATNNKLYWIGNLCLDGKRACGNWPRSPLVIAQIQEEPFAIYRDTITVIDVATPREPEFVQHSNFKTYQDRLTGEVVIYLTRYGELGTDNNDWLQANLYEYRVSLD